MSFLILALVLSLKRVEGVGCCEQLWLSIHRVPTWHLGSCSRALSLSSVSLSLSEQWLLAAQDTSML